jgi:T-complex protein 1 subunit beta
LRHSSGLNRARPFSPSNLKKLILTSLCPLQQSFVGAIAIADLVKTTLGPKGMDKILQSMGDMSSRKQIVVTNDGATILKSIYIDNPAAKILIDISMTQDEEVGDGTTTVTVMAGELLREAEKLVSMRIHP